MRLIIQESYSQISHWAAAYIVKKINDLLQGLLGFILTGHILEGDAGLLFHVDLGVGLAHAADAAHAVDYVPDAVGSAVCYETMNLAVESVRMGAPLSRDRSWRKKADRDYKTAGNKV